MEAVMKRIVKLGLLFTSTLLFYSAAYSTNIPNTDNPLTFLGPTARVGFTSTLNDYTAYNLAGEAGIKNFRVGGTLGWKLAENQYFKVSAEYLWQEITYAFFSGDSDQWVNQGAVGAAYQYEFSDWSYRPQFDLSAYASHAPNKTLGTVSGVFQNHGVLTPFTDHRRIAGSNGAGASPGIAIMPWQGARLSLAANYDSVRYDTKTGPNENAIGWGGTVGFNQAVTDSLGLGAAAAFRQPFNNYAANIYWSDVPYLGNRWTLGLFGDYTDGKNTLPDTYNVGLSANYFFDQRCGVAVPRNLKGENLKGEMMMQPIADNLLAWTADPAVYMPQVLAIVDPNVSFCPDGVAPTLISAIPSDTVNTGSVNEAIHFSGKNLTFSIASITHSGGGSGTLGGDTITISPNGVLTWNTTIGGDGPYTVVIKAANACGSVLSHTFTIGSST